MAIKFNFCFDFFGFFSPNLIWFQRLGRLSYFAGAENKDERVLVPDLGSLTSIYDRFKRKKKKKTMFLKCFFGFFFFKRKIYIYLWKLIWNWVAGLVSCSIIWKVGKSITVKNTAEFLVTRNSAACTNKVNWDSCFLRVLFCFYFFFSSNNNQLYSQILYNIDGY